MKYANLSRKYITNQPESWSALGVIYHFNGKNKEASPLQFKVRNLKVKDVPKSNTNSMQDSLCKALPTFEI